MIDLLKKLVSINSIFPNEKEIANFLFELLNNYNFKVQKQYLNKDRFNLLAEKGDGNFSILFYAHMDTVPVYGNWSNDPFKLIIKDDRAIGLGSVDVKGGLVSIIEATKNFNPRNFKLKVAFGVDEENYSQGAFYLSQSEYINDVKLVLVPESTLPYHKSDKASSIISIGRKGRIVFKLKIYGISTHGVNKEKGINAIEEASKLVLFLNNFNHKFNEKMGYSHCFVSSIKSCSKSLSIPDEAEIILDFHTVPNQNSVSLKKDLENFINDLYSENRLKKGYKNFEISYIERPTPFLEAFENKQNNFLQVVSNSVKEVYNQVSYNYGESVSDENVFGFKGIETYTIGPLGDNHHSADEWVSIKSLEKLSLIYKKILNKIDLLLQ